MKRIIIFLSVLIFSYLCGSFYSLSFDISYWSAECRGTTMTIGVTLALAISSFPFIDELFK